MTFQCRKVVKTFLTEDPSLINKLETLGKKFVKNENLWLTFV